MNIELTKQEAELLDTALDLWEKEPHSTGMVSLMLGSLFRGERSKQEIEAVSRAEQDTARKEAHRRRMQSALIRVKIAQALNRDSEHDVIQP